MRDKNWDLYGSVEWDGDDGLGASGLSFRIVRTSWPDGGGWWSLIGRDGDSDDWRDVASAAVGVAGQGPDEVRDWLIRMAERLDLVRLARQRRLDDASPERLEAAEAVVAAEIDEIVRSVVPGYGTFEDDATWGADVAVLDRELSRLRKDLDYLRGIAPSYGPRP